MTWRSAGSEAQPSPAFCTIGGQPVVLVRTGDGWLAAEDRCSHAGCAFSTDGEIDGATAICNCHGSEFDLRSGEAQVPPASDPIATFATRVSEAGLEVWM